MNERCWLVQLLDHLLDHSLLLGLLLLLGHVRLSFAVAEQVSRVNRGNILSEVGNLELRVPF